MPPASPARRLLPLVLILIGVLGLTVPLKLQGWAQWIGDKVRLVIAPISHPMSAVVRWLGHGRYTPPEDSAIRVLQEQLEQTTAALNRSEQENQRLKKLIEEVGVLSKTIGQQPVRPVKAAVYATSSDVSTGIMHVIAGKRDGVFANTAAVAEGLQLVGRITYATDRESTLVPITARSASPLRAMIMLGDSTDGLVCTLEPRGDGTLRGPVEDRRDPQT